MRRRAAFYLFLGLMTGLLIVALATGLQTGGSTDPNVWLRAHRHLFLLQMLDLASLLIFVVIGLNGLMVTRLQLQLRHQAEDFGDQMQSLVHRNDELVKVNEEYAEQIAALEADQEAKPALSVGDTGQKVISALHWQVDAQARQLEAVHRALEQQHSALEELQQHVQVLEGSGAPPLTGTPASPQLAEAVAPVAMPEPEIIALQPEATGPDTEEDLLDVAIMVAEWTGNDGSTLIGEMLEFDVGGFLTSEPEPASSSAPRPIFVAETRSYPVDDSLLAVAAGHLSSMPEPAAAPPPEPEPERIQVSVGAAAATPSPEAQAVVAPEVSPPRTRAAAAFDMAESALSSLHSETREALSSLRAEVEATLPPEPAATPPADASENSGRPARRKPWHLRF